MITILGCRGSVPVSGASFARYGGATSCVFLRLGGQAVILDAGTGILNLPPFLSSQETELPLLLSHPHVDHLLGLPMCPAALCSKYHFHVWVVDRQGMGPKEQLQTLMAPPLWPVELDRLPAAFAFHTITHPFAFGPIQVEFLEGIHPGGVTLFRLTNGRKTVVYLTDCNLQGAMMEQAAMFAKDCDVLLCDGQYSREEWTACSGFGHSTWEMAAQLGELCHAGLVRIIHHDPSHTDNFLDLAATQLAAKYPYCQFAFEGEEILL